MDANNSFYVKFVATYAATLFGYIFSVLAMVQALQVELKTYNSGEQCEKP